MLFKRKMNEIAEGKKDVSEMDSFRSYIGRKVIAKSGDNAGKIYDVLFKGREVCGIVVSRRASKLFIARSFIADVSEKAVMLGITPVFMMLGKKVFDMDGKNLGRVVGVSRKGKSNAFDSIEVKKRFWSKKESIPKSEIDVAKKGVILNRVR